MSAAVVILALTHTNYADDTNFFFFLPQFWQLSARDTIMVGYYRFRFLFSLFF